MKRIALAALIVILAAPLASAQEITLSRCCDPTGRCLRFPRWFSYNWSLA